jgi:hypothetical protein
VTRAALIAEAVDDAEHMLFACAKTGYMAIACDETGYIAID